MTSRRAFLLGGGAALLGACSPQPVPPGRSVARLWFTYGGKNRATLETLVARFNAAQSQHFVSSTFQGDYYEGLAKLRTALAARVAPTFSHVVGEIVPYLHEAGVLEALDERPGAREFDLIDALGQKGSWQDGDRHPLVALPFNRSTPIAYLNSEIFGREGRKAPTTWSELTETASALTKRDGSTVTRYGFGCPIDWWFWAALVGQAGGDVVERDGSVTLGGEAGVQALTLWHRLVNELGVMKPPPGRDYNAWEATNQDFLAGRAAMIWTSTAFVRYFEDNAKFPVIAAPLPGFVRRAVPTGGTHWVMLKQAPEHEKASAWAFLRFMHEAEQVAFWASSTGYIPVTHGAVKKLEGEGFYRRHPNDRVALDQLDVARPWPWSTELFRIQREIVQPRLEAAILGHSDVRAVLDEARAAARSAG